MYIIHMHVQSTYIMTMTMILLLLDVLLMMLAALMPISYSSNISATMAAAAAAAAADNDIAWASRNQQQDNIEVAIEEMQRANYFTFVMLIKMAPPDLMILLGGNNNNVTFLMPNDKTLSQNNIIIPPGNHINSVADFLLRHSIPSPLLFEHLQHFPTGSTLPTSKPDFVLRVTNDGRRLFFLNNVRITRPNICTRGSSIRCHGIDGVIQALVPPPPPPSADQDQCRNTGNTSTSTTSPPALSPPPENGTTTSSSPAPPPGEANSASLRISEILTTCLVFLLMVLNWPYYYY